MSEVQPQAPGGELGPVTVLSQPWTGISCLQQEGNGTIQRASINNADGGNMYAFWNMSAWSHGDDAGLRASLTIGLLAPLTIDVLTNASNMHVAMLRRRALAGSQAGPLTVTATSANGSTVTDTQDYIALTTVEIGSPAIWERAGSRYGPADPACGSYGSVPFHSRGGDLVVCVSASGFSATGGLIGANLQLDGRAKCSVGIYASDANAHQAMVPADFIWPGVAAGDHVLSLVPAAGTSISQYDYSDIMVLELLAPSSLMARSAPLACSPAAAQGGDGLVASSVFATNGGVLLVTVAASAYVAAAGTMIGMFILIDDQVRGDIRLFANYANAHLCLVGNDLVAGVLAPGLHTIKLQAMPGTITDGNDRCSITIIEVPAAWT